MMLVGNARVSTQDQTLDLQKDALEKIGCTRIYTDTASGAKAERKGLEDALGYVREGDILVVWRLDRLGRSLRHLIETVTELDKKGIGFKSKYQYISFLGFSGANLLKSLTLCLENYSSGTYY